MRELFSSLLTSLSGLIERIEVCESKRAATGGRGVVLGGWLLRNMRDCLNAHAHLQVNMYNREENHRLMSMTCGSRCQSTDHLRTSRMQL